MARLVYSMLAPLDGYTADEQGGVRQQEDNDESGNSGVQHAARV